MDEAQRRQLVEGFNGFLTWKGRKVKLAGIKNPSYCTITTSLPGFWAASWETVDRVAVGSGSFDGEFLWLISNAWLGCE